MWKNYSPQGPVVTRSVKELRAAYPRAVLETQLFAAYYTDLGDDEVLYFVRMPRDTARCLAAAMVHMQVCERAELFLREEEPFYRNGYVNEKIRLHMIRRHPFLTVKYMQRIVTEMVTALGFRLRWLPIEDLLNLKQSQLYGNND